MERRMLSRSALFAAACVAASAQGIYKNANSPKDGVCPLVQADKSDLNFGTAFAHPYVERSDNPSNGTSVDSTAGLKGADSVGKAYYQQGDYDFPLGQRRDVSAFTAYDAKALGTSVASLKGKVVLVGLWSTRCDPSARMLLEMAQLYPKGPQYGFQVLAVNFDLNQQDGGEEGGIEGGWRAINKFMIKNRSFFEASHMPVYTPGLGKEGASNFMPTVQSLPALFVIDRQGRLASIHIGYKDGFVGEALKRTLLEKAQPLAPPAPVK